MLVVEVADTSLQQDRITKLGIYAAAGLPEVWIVNLREDCVEVYRNPNRSSRRYGAKTVVPRAGTLEALSLSDPRIAAKELLPVGA